MAELKKCPFCGGEAEIDWYPNNNNDTLWNVECTNCGCSLHFSPNKTKEEAIEAWNNRVTEAFNHGYKKALHDFIVLAKEKFSNDEITVWKLAQLADQLKEE